MLKLQQVNALQELYQEIKDNSLPLPVAYKFSKLFTILENETKFFQDNFQKIIDECAEKDSQGEFIILEGGDIKIQEGKKQKCNLKLLELQDLEIKLPEVRFSLRELSPLELSIKQVQLLFPFIEETSLFEE